jgi:hypothetical protein
MEGQTPETSGVRLLGLQVRVFGKLIPERDGENGNEGDDRRNKEEVHGKAPGNKPDRPVLEWLCVLLSSDIAKGLPNLAQVCASVVGLIFL